MNAGARGVELRRSVYGGHVFFLPASPESLALVDFANELLQREFEDVGSPALAQFRLSNAEWLSRVGRVRQGLTQGVTARRLFGRWLLRHGFDPTSTVCDQLRLRAVRHEGHTIPEAAAVYYAHRDTWYANPQAQLNVWLALHDVPAAQSFEIYPNYFEAPVENDSERFDYTTWSREVGFQRSPPRSAARASAAIYPSARADLDRSRARAIARARGEVVVFSAAHLHQTCAQALGSTRFSLDVRVVDLHDHARGCGAPNVDNRSRGSTLPSYAPWLEEMVDAGAEALPGEVKQ